MKKFSIIMLCLGLLLAFSAPASALPDLGPICEIVKFKFSDYTWIVDNDGNGEISFGDGIEAILTITTISNVDDSNIYWSSGDQGAELTGISSGLTVLSIDPHANGNFIMLDTSSGQMDMYWDTAMNYDPSIADLSEQIATATDGDPYWSAEFTEWYQIVYSYGSNGAPDFLPPDGDDAMTANGYFNLTENYTGRIFDQVWTDLSPSAHPAQFKFDCTFYSTDYPNYDFRSENPIMAHTVPEPATMLLLGSGLLGLAGTARRRFNKKA